MFTINVCGWIYFFMLFVVYFAWSVDRIEKWSVFRIPYARHIHIIAHIDDTFALVCMSVYVCMRLLGARYYISYWIGFVFVVISSVALSLVLFTSKINKLRVPECIFCEKHSRHFDRFYLFSGFSVWCGESVEKYIQYTHTIRFNNEQCQQILKYK